MTAVLALAFTAAAGWVMLIATAPFLHGFIAAFAYGVGSLICHQLPERSFHLNGVQLPVCARCTGIYVGAAVGVLVVPWVRRVAYPRASILIALTPALVSVAIEWIGLGRPSNAVRAATGIVGGLVVAVVVLATLHYERCAPPRPTAPSPPPTPT